MLRRRGEIGSAESSLSPRIISAKYSFPIRISPLSASNLQLTLQLQTSLGIESQDDFLWKLWVSGES